MKAASLPHGVDHLNCWCGSLCKVKEVTDFSDWFGMKFFMCPNYEYDPPVRTFLFARPLYVLIMMNRHTVSVIISLLLTFCLCCSLLCPCASGIAGLTLSSRNGLGVMLLKGTGGHGKVSSRRSVVKKLRSVAKKLRQM